MALASEYIQNSTMSYCSVPATLIQTSVLFCFPVSALSSLGSSLYIETRVILLKHRPDHFTSLLITLSWFPILHSLKPSFFHYCLLLFLLLTPPQPHFFFHITFDTFCYLKMSSSLLPQVVLYLTNILGKLFPQNSYMPPSFILDLC